ncbi:Protein FMP27, mitochondrial [Metarhizium acridum]|nr:Protein FMP27, mitochondrial [Metarhizium acridum]
MMKAITTSQRKFEIDSDTSALLKWSISARDIVWHLIQDSAEPLVELQLKDVEYDRTDNSDGSHMNLIRVGKVLGLNLLPDATYPEIIAPYSESDRNTMTGDTEQDMIRVYWHMLESIAGIPVMDRFEV